MKITICASITSTPKIKEITDDLRKMGHEIHIPFTSQRIINGELTMEEFLRDKSSGDNIKWVIDNNLIKSHYEAIKNSDAILVVNIEKKGVAGYIGGNTFLEIGFAHVLDKKIYLYNDIPDMIYTDEIKVVQPIVLNQDLSKI